MALEVAAAVLPVVTPGVAEAAVDLLITIVPPCLPLTWNERAILRLPVFCTWGPIHTGGEHANLQAIPVMLLASSVNTPIHSIRFHLLAFTPVHPVWIGPRECIFCDTVSGETCFCNTRSKSASRVYS